MIEIPEEVKEYNRGGSRLEKDVYRQVSHLLVLERLSRRRTIDEISELVALPAQWIEKQELRRKRLNWCVVAALLKTYKKRLVVRLADVEEEKVGTLTAN